MFRDAPISLLDRPWAMKRTICFSRSVKGLVATLASSKDSFAIGEPFIPPLSKARWRLRIWNGLQLTVCDCVRLLTVLLTTRQGVDYGRKESRQMSNGQETHAARRW